MMTRPLPGQAERLRRLGVDPAHVGRIFNGPTTRTGTPPDDVERITIPDSPLALEELLADTGRMQRVFADKDAFGQLISKYAKVVLDKDQEIATQVREETQRTLGAWLKENEAENIARLNLTPETGPSPRMSMGSRQDRKNALYNAHAMGAAIDGEFATSAEYFQTIWHQTQKDAPTQAKIGRLRNAFASTVPSEGGFLIPEQLRSELLAVALETAIVRPRARVIPMETLRVPFPAIDQTSHVSSVFGGVVGYWTEEGAALTESAASFGRIVLDAKKLTAYTTVPNELISDSAISFTAFIDQIFPEALAWYEDDAFLNGNGVGEPLGMLSTNNTSVVAVTKQTNQPAATIQWENIVGAYARMFPASLNRAIWICSPDTFPELATMALSVGTGGSAIWLNNGAAGPPMTILGRPVIVSEKAATLGSQGDISFVDPGFYLIGDRQVMSAMSSPHFQFSSDKTAYRIIERVDGRPWLQSAITPKNNGPTLSAFVQIGAR